MTGTMAGNIIATIPTTHTTRNEAITPTSGVLNMLAIVAIGRTGAAELICMGEEVCSRKAERYHAPIAATRRGTPIEALKPNLDHNVSGNRFPVSAGGFVKLKSQTLRDGGH